MDINKVISHPGIIVEMIEDYYASCAGVDFNEIKVEHGRYFINKNYYLYVDLMSKDLDFYERAFKNIVNRGEYRDKILKNERGSN